MKQLSEERLKNVFEKLTKYIGPNVKLLIDRPDGGYCFREQKNRVYYMSEKMLGLASNVSADHLVSAGTCFGKFTKSGKFQLGITALTYLAPYAQYKVWLKPSAEQQFLYGHHVLKSGMGRITENTAKYQGVLVLSMNDLPLCNLMSFLKRGRNCGTCISFKKCKGFGVAAKSTAECKLADPLSIVCFHQADIGEYLRSEEILV